MVYRPYTRRLESLVTICRWHYKGTTLKDPECSLLIWPRKSTALSTKLSGQLKTAIPCRSQNPMNRNRSKIITDSKRKSQHGIEARKLKKVKDNRRIFVYTFCLINICLSLSDDANKIKTLNIERA